MKRQKQFPEQKRKEKKEKEDKEKEDKENGMNLGFGVFILIGAFLIAILAFSEFDNDMEYIINENMITKTYEVEEINEGEFWFVRNYSRIGTGDNTTLILQTHDTEIHFVFSLENQFEMRYVLCENATVSDNGTQIMANNRNRNYPGGDSVDFFVNPNMTDTGNILAEARYGDKKKLGGKTIENNKFILAENSTFCIIAHNEAASVNNFNYYFEWYEDE